MKSFEIISKVKAFLEEKGYTDGLSTGHHTPLGRPNSVSVSFCVNHVRIRIERLTAACDVDEVVSGMIEEIENTIRKK
jgi:hypothetical protein